ncbi:winged helix DNA-binding domain-containing protein [Aquipuribacter hungaricus]|uniref:Winged helix DNA-binding domain-containing protein n=1 Tax=Aquipuribacter hungaricus TaxID=545624 RepID=A0ABV7WKG0_9MICO
MIATGDVGLLRLVALGLVGVPGGTDPATAVRGLLAAQAQDLPGAVTSVALRSRPSDRAAVLSAMDAGTLVRSWPMRGTLHLVAAEDLPWLLPLAGPRMVARSAARRRELGLDDRTVALAGEVALAALADGAALSRAELMATWERSGVATTGQRGYHLLAHLAETGRVCLGPTTGTSTEQLVVASDGWLPEVPAVDRDEALARLARRYLGSHGPATVADLARWASLPVTEVRRGVAAVRAELEAVAVEGRDGVEHLLDPSVRDRLAACREEAEGVLLLPGFDEYLLGYADRDAVLAPAHAERIVPGRNGVFRPTVVVGGQVVATWRHVPSRRGAPASVDVDGFDALPAGVAERVREVHAALP